jgi:hypothetical protein
MDRLAIYLQLFSQFFRQLLESADVFEEFKPILKTSHIADLHVACRKSQINRLKGIIGSTV